MSHIKNTLVKKTKAQFCSWRSVIQTPFDASIKIDVAGPFIRADLDRLLKNLGCERRVANKDNGKTTSIDFDDNRCWLYRWEFQADFRSGFWQVVLYTTKELTVDAEHRMLAVGRKKNGK